jgi:hypothetical protein
VKAKGLITEDVGRFWTGLGLGAPVLDEWLDTTRRILLDNPPLK